MFVILMLDIGNRLDALKAQNETGHHPYKVHRWRLESSDEQSILAISKSRKSQGQIKHHTSDDNFKQSRAISVPNGAEPDLSIVPAQSSPTADQLLHLIHFNVLRGLLSIKAILGALAVSWASGSDPEPFDARFPTFSMVLPVAPGLPKSKDPTASQMNLTHSAWISMMPFPAMREALIRSETSFDHAEFANDVIGSLLPSDLFKLPSALTFREPVPRRQLLLSNGADDEVTADQDGLILWGEPYLVESWEATPGFLQKWAWALEGCEDLIESSNRWRVMRGEEPMCFSRVHELPS